MPAAARRSIFSLAVSSLPSTIVPAWPKLIPGISSMKRPAMKATIGSRDHLGHVAAGDPLGDDHHQLDVVLQRLEHGVLGEGGGDGDHRAVDRAAVAVDDLGDRVVYRHAVDLAALAPRCHAAHDLGA